MSGEYAVLDGAPAIVAAVARHLTCEVSPSARFGIRGAGLAWEEGGAEVGGLSFARAAFDTARRYLAGKGGALPPVLLEIRDDLRAPDGQKLGLGGSACACVAVTAALLSLAGLDLDELGRDRLFKLSACAHARAQGKIGSAVDIAAATYGGCLLTHRFDATTCEQAWPRSDRAFAQAIDETPRHPVDRLPEPPGLLLSFSGKSASTPGLVAAVKQGARLQPELWRRFLASMGAATCRMEAALRSQDAAGLLASVTEAGATLDLLEPLAGFDVATPAHRAFARLAERLGCAAKSSGAGGGDCAFAVGAPEQLDALQNAEADRSGHRFQVAIDGDGAALVRDA